MAKKRIFITGIPTAGKSFLGSKLAGQVGGICISVDPERKAFIQDEEHRKWVNFYRDQDEYMYYTTTTYDEQWENLVRQSEGLWSKILEKIHRYDSEEKAVIFEGVNLLPHLAHRDLAMPGITLIGRSLEETLERDRQKPRWGKTEELQKFEADAFFNGERLRYRAESEKYGYKVFETADEAWTTAVELLS